MVAGLLGTDLKHCLCHKRIVVDSLPPELYVECQTSFTSGGEITDGPIEPLPSPPAYLNTNFYNSAVEEKKISENNEVKHSRIRQEAGLSIRSQEINRIRGKIGAIHFRKTNQWSSFSKVDQRAFEPAGGVQCVHSGKKPNKMSIYMPPNPKVYIFLGMHSPCPADGVQVASQSYQYIILYSHPRAA
ncbi:hypothetical protein ACTXT7_012767 [Hymenolepis weldensis]